MGVVVKEQLRRDPRRTSPNLPRIAKARYIWGGPTDVVWIPPWLPVGRGFDPLPTPPKRSGRCLYEGPSFRCVGTH